MTSKPTIRETMEAVAVTMGEPVDWSFGGIRKTFGGEHHHAAVEMEAKIQTDLGTMAVRIQMRVVFRQRTSDEAVGSVEYAAHATEAAALAFTIESDVGELRWTHDDHQALYEQLKEEHQS